MIKPTTVTNYAIRSPEFDFRRDLHTFVAYVRERPVKRKTHGNDLMKGDVKRLSKLLSYPHIMAEYNQRSFSVWIDFVDTLALALEFVDYDTKGEYRGYSSSEPSFTDNYIEYRRDVYQRFLALDINQQEKQLLDQLLLPYSYSHNEFFGVSPVGWLDAFSTHGSAVGILPHVDFANARSFLLQQLSQLEVGVWYETASWVASLKQVSPYFLIPEKPMREKRGYGYGYYYNRNQKKSKEPEYEAVPRYENLYEYEWGRREDAISDDAPDGFERVEGRYIERFLEYIPLVMGYVELAYAPDHPQNTQRFSRRDEPIDRDIIKAFRVTPLLKQTLDHALPAPSVTVQPNFEVVIEAPVYPASFLRVLSAFGSVTPQSRTTTVTLDKQAVAAAVAEDETLDVIAILKTHARHGLPQNVLIELQEWVKRADVFTVYHGLDLVEDHIGVDTVANAAQYTIDDHLYLVNRSHNMSEQLQNHRQVVLQMVHFVDAFDVIPKHTKSIFPHEEDLVPEPETVTVQQESYITLRFPRQDVLDAVRQGLLDARCPVTFNPEAQSLTFPGRYQATLMQVIAALADTYTIKIQEMPS